MIPPSNSRKKWEEEKETLRDSGDTNRVMPELFTGGKLLFEGFKILPERVVLLQHLLLGYRKFEPVDEVSERVFMQDIVAVESPFVPLKVESILPSPQSIKCFPITVETAQALIRMLERLSRQRTDLLDQAHLDKFVETIELTNALFAEVDLEHRREPPIMPPRETLANPNLGFR